MSFDPSNAAAQFRERGFLVLERALEPPKVESYLRQLEALSGRARSSFAPRPSRPWRRRGGVYGAWILPDGVSKTKGFWDVLFEPRLVDLVRTVLGPRAAYLQHSDLHVGFSAVTWHRDNVDRRYGRGPDWDEAVEPYRLARVGIYLQSSAESGFALGLVPGSHRRGTLDERDQRALDAALGWLPQARRLLLGGHDPLGARAQWIDTEPGDAIVFDPRILHSGSFTSGPKYSLFFGYGVPGDHADRHRAYYRHLRRELGYEDIDAALVARLRQEGLFAEEGDAASAFREAFRPSWLRSQIGRAVRQGPKSSPAEATTTS